MQMLQKILENDEHLVSNATERCAVMNPLNLAGVRILALRLFEDPHVLAGRLNPFAK